MVDSALVIIDVQKGLDDPALGQRNNPEAEQNIARLLQAWRSGQLPVIHIRHCSTEPGSALRPEADGNAFKKEVLPLPGEALFDKSANSAFVGTGLGAYLCEQGIGSLVMTGLTTDHCVSASVKMASDLGFEVTLVADASATFERTGPDATHHSAEQVHAVTLASLNEEFCSVRSTDEVLADMSPHNVGEKE